MDEDLRGEMGGAGEPTELFDYPAATHRRSEEGTVVAVRGDIAEVMLRRSRFCEGCGSCCVQVSDDAMLAEAENRAGAKEGDRVVVDLPMSASIRAAYVLYGIPLISFLLGIAVGALLGSVLFEGRFNVALGLIFGFGFLAVSFILLSRIYAPGSRASSRYRLVITQVLS